MKITISNQIQIDDIPETLERKIEKYLTLNNRSDHIKCGVGVYAKAKLSGNGGGYPSLREKVAVTVLYRSRKVTP